MLFTSQCILSYVAMLYLKSIVITAAKPLVQLVCKRYRAVLASGAAYRYNKLVFTLIDIVWNEKLYHIIKLVDKLICLRKLHDIVLHLLIIAGFRA